MRLTWPYSQSQKAPPTLLAEPLHGNGGRRVIPCFAYFMGNVHISLSKASKTSWAWNWQAITCVMQSSVAKPSQTEKTLLFRSVSRNNENLVWCCCCLHVTLEYISSSPPLFKIMCWDFVRLKNNSYPLWKMEVIDHWHRIESEKFMGIQSPRDDHHEHLWCISFQPFLNVYEYRCYYFFPPQTQDRMCVLFFDLPFSCSNMF